MRIKNYTSFWSLTLGLFLVISVHAQQKPNVIIILADDMGYSDISCYGSEIRTPNIDALAAGGIKFRTFYNTTKCSPTRASMLTGQYPHEAGMEGLSNSSGNSPAFLGYLPKNVVTLAEVFKTNGYGTYMSGKWHLGEDAGRWPRNRGFDNYWGLISGGSSYYELITPDENPNETVLRKMAYNDQAWDPDNTNDPNNPYAPGTFYMTNATGDFAIDFLENHFSTRSSAPFFLHLSFTAPHWPLHAFESDIAKYNGVYDVGFDVIREKRFANMKALGIIPQDTKLSPRDHDIKWETLTKAQKDDYIRRMQVYAGMMDNMDQNIGRVIQLLKNRGKFNNTIILFLSDNGGSREDAEERNLHDARKKIGEKGSYVSYLRPWSNVSNTPFRMHKNDTYEGGITTPLIMHYPNGITNAGSITRQISHVKDIMPTLLEMTNISYPSNYQGNAIKAMSGVSFKHALDNPNDIRSREMFFEFSGKRAVRHNDWKIVSESTNGQWYLYNLENDFTEQQDIRTSYPDISTKLQKRYNLWEISVGHKSGSLPASNKPPVLVKPINDQIASEGILFDFTFANDAFTDDPSDDIVFEATLSNGQQLPTWLKFDDLLRKFTGVPPSGSLANPITIRLTALDWAKNKTVDEFKISKDPNSGGNNGGGGSPAGSCLLVVENPAALNGADQDAKSRLELLGYAVTVADDEASKVSDALDKDVILISSTCDANRLGDKFKNVAIPIVMWEVSIFPLMGMTNSVLYQDYGGRASQSKLIIENPTHPLAAGLSAGEQIVGLKSDVFLFGIPNNQAISIASLTDRTDRKTVFAYDEGTQMFGLVAPARRVAIYFDDDGLKNANTLGLSLFDAAVCWASGNCNESKINLAFVTPTDQQVFAQGSNVSVSVSASDEDGSISNVRLFLNGQLVRQLNNAPYTWSSATDPLLSNMAAGSYVLLARATDNRGNIAETSITISIQSNNTNNQPPIVRFEVPNNLQTYQEGEELYVKVDASDNDGTISVVRLYFDGTLLRDERVPPFEWGGTVNNDPEIQNLQAGTHTLRTVATDNGGATSEATINITVTTAGTNLPPEITFVNPKDGQTLVSGTSLTVRTDAIDADGTVSGVRLSLDGQFIAEDNTAPYEWASAAYSQLANLQVGSHTFQATATDNHGATSQTSIVVNVIAPSGGNMLPIVDIITPKQGNNFPVGTNVKVQATATDLDGSVTRVLAYLNGRALRRDTEAPYEWDGASSADPLLSNMKAGTYELKVAAIDNLNESGQTIVTFTVGETSGGGGTTNTPPTVVITSPTNGQTFTAGSTVTVNVAASDTDGSIANVMLYYDGALFSTDVSAPYSWSIANVTTGTHTLRAVATDDKGATVETTHTINVSSTSGGGNSLPVVSFKTPTNGTVVSVGTNLFVEVLASDSDGSINGVDLYFDGQFVRNERLGPYEWGKSTQSDVLLQNIQAGTHTLRAVATDNRNGTSEQVIVIQAGTGTTNTPPTVALTAPVNGQAFPAGTTLSVRANATDSDGTVAKVDLYLNGQFVRTDATAPYEWGAGDVLLTNLSTGTYTLRATATDDDNATTSQTITFTVNASASNTPPTVTFVTPASQQIFNEGTNLFVKVDATDSDGTVVGVQLYLNNTLVRDDTSLPFEWGSDLSMDAALQNLVAGRYTLKVIARDDDGATRESSIEIEVITTSGNFLPIVNFVAPVEGQVFPSGSDIYVRVDATDPDGTISNVRLNLNGAFIRKESIAPYEWGDPAQSNDTQLYDLRPGQYQLTAFAFDNAGNRTTKSVNITVSSSSADNPAGLSNSNSPTAWINTLENAVTDESSTDEMMQEIEVGETENRTTPMDELLEISTIIVYPNPSDRVLTIELLTALTSTTTLELYNNMGQLILSDRLPANTTGKLDWDVSHLPTGLYSLKINAENMALIHQKVVISH